MENCQYEPCGKPYKVKRKDQRFCSPKCLSLDYQPMTISLSKGTWTGECPKCHETITVNQKDNEELQ